MMSATTTDVLALLRACCEAPDDDTVRLVLADAVQESGFAGTAAFIRDDIAMSDKRARKSGIIPKSRVAYTPDYVRWMASLFGDDAMRFSSIHALGWDQMHWFNNDLRKCTFTITRGLPMHLSTTAIMLMERAAKQFLFPLTGVMVSDRRPWRDDMGVELMNDAVAYGWSAMPYPSKWETWIETPSEIPVTLYHHLAPSVDTPATPTTPRHVHNRGHYWKAKDAIDDLNRAAMSFGKATRPPVARN
jgi:uncharacterized protein (TIGR02996 family)